MTISGYSISIEGVAALVNSLVLVPSIVALRKIATSHETRISSLEAPPRPKRARRDR
jgi:hypothetical protein